MKIRYDLHLHSGLSPCADKDMTPANILGFAVLSGLNMVAVSDHNSIKNVETCLKIGEAYGITVVPAFELQTAEDIHLLCLFEDYSSLMSFYDCLEFQKVKNDAEIFGHQYIYDEEDNIVGEESNLLLASSTISSHLVPTLIARYGGVAVPAHIDRDANSMLQILGDITPEFKAIELSTRAERKTIDEYESRFRVIIDSDAHTLDAISTKSELELDSATPSALLSYLRSEK